MSHQGQMDFVRRIHDEFPEFFRMARVLEVGSRYINGSVRPFFTQCDYTGIDAVPGRDVDVVCLAHEFVPDRDEPFDTIISCEAFEHDPYFSQTIPRILSYLRPGGMFLATWASPKRQEHGTRRTDGDIGLFGPDPDYYRGIGLTEFYKLAQPFLDPLMVAVTRSDLDVYANGFRK